jgi:16S rRNA (guanine(1405)-N(7))-methyltransferase
MPKLILSTTDAETIAQEILSSSKYRSLAIPMETVVDLIQREAEKNLDRKSIIKNSREKLHHIVATYLGDPEQQKTIDAIDQASSSANQDEIAEVCISILNKHASTRERIEIRDEFYPGIFEKIGIPTSILDLACGLNPFFLPWMGILENCAYHAYDINLPRLNLIQHFFDRVGQNGQVHHQDILLQPPTERADAAFLFKETHRIEQRRKYSNIDLWKALNVKYLVVSLPTANLTGQHSLIERHRNLMASLLDGLNWPTSEIVFKNEMVFIIEKS